MGTSLGASFGYFFIVPPVLLSLSVVLGEVYMGTSLGASFGYFFIVPRTAVIVCGSW